MPTLADYLLAGPGGTGGNFGTMSPGEEAVAVTPGSVLDAAARSAYRLGATPRDAMRTAVQPTGGMVSDVDMARALLSEGDVGKRTADLATTLIGAGAPAAETGAAGIFGGKLAKTADQAALTKAQEMAKAGHYADEIWDQTGWFQGADQKWRFEIPDQAARFQKGAMQPKEYRIMGNSIDALTGNAGQVLEHPELWRAYPELADTTVVQGRGANFKGQFNRPAGDGDRGSISLNLDQLSTEPELRSTSLHELQHAIQDQEGFAPGSSQEYMKGYDNPEFYAYRKALINDPELARYKQLHASPEYQQELAAQNELWKAKYQPELNAIEDKAISGGRDNWIAHKPLMDEVFARANAEFAKLYPTMSETDRIYKSLTSRGVPTREPQPTLDPYQAYRRTAGEVEARNVQSRMDMSAEKRQTLPPIFTEDVPREEQLTRVGQGGLYQRQGLGDALLRSSNQ